MIRFVLVREGKADAELVSVLTRLCASLGVTSIQGADGAGLGVGRRVADQVDAALHLEPDLDLVFVHMDADNEGLEVRRECLRTALLRCPRPYARVVPVRATAQRPRKHQKREFVPISDDDCVRCRSELLESLDIDGPINQLSAWQALVLDIKAALARLGTPSKTDPCPPSTNS